MCEGLFIIERRLLAIVIGLSNAIRTPSESKSEWASFEKFLIKGLVLNYPRTSV